MLPDTTLQNVRSRALLIRTMPNMDKLSSDEIVLAAENTRVRRFRAGENVPMVRRTERLLYIVAAGQVRSTSGLAEVIVGARDNVGWSEWLADVEAPTVVALEDSNLLELSADFMLRALEDNYAFSRAIVRGNAERILDLRGGLPRSGHEQTAESTAPPPTVGDTLLDRLMLFGGGPLDQGSLDAAIAVARRMKRVRFKPGETIFSLGEASRWWVNMLGGEVECSNESGATLVQGEYTIGVMDAIAERPRSYRAVAKTEVLAYVIRYEDFAIVLETHPDLALGTVRMTSRTVSQLSQSVGSVRPGPTGSI